MTFVFPIDRNGIAAAVRSSGEDDFHIPVIIYGADGVTPISTVNPMPVAGDFEMKTNGQAISESNPLATKLTGSNLLQANVQKVAIAGTRVQLPDITCKELTIIALKSNTGSIYVGDANVSSTVFGVELEAKDSITLPINNINQIYIDASVSGEGVSYVAL